MKESNDELNERIDRNLRKAYQQIQFRPEWAERVLCEIANESAQKTVAKQTVITLPRSRKSWRAIAVLAAGVLLAILCRWLALPPERPSVSDWENPVVVHSDLPDELPLKRNATESLESGTLSVSAAPGYLAARLTDDPEFEIYVILPARQPTVTN